jgi:hypothetical protein
MIRHRTVTCHLLYDEFDFTTFFSQDGSYSALYKRTEDC